MELRTGVEVEAAGLAAERASSAQIKKIRDCFVAIQKGIDQGGSAVDEDFQFHCSIADATDNPQFKRFLDYLGRFIIPRRTVWQPSAPASKRAQLNIFQHEHEQVLKAVANHEPAEARAAMQRHLLNSRTRHEKLAARNSKSGSGARKSA
jgi:DNA-binding FadR family transcriptional regulator